MDTLGKVAREYLKTVHEMNVKQAYVLAKDFKKDGLHLDEIEEMLFSSGYDAIVIDSALNRLQGKPEA